MRAFLCPSICLCIYSILPMPVTHFIAHKINKESKDLGAMIEYCPNAPEVTDFTQSIMSQLKAVFVQRAGKRYGRFDVENSACKAQCQNWLAGQQGFESFTKNIGKLFQEKLDNTQHEIEGYLVFLAEELVDSEHFYAFHVRERSNVALNDNMELVKNSYIDFSNTGFAFDLNTTLFKEMLEGEGHSQYITFCFGRGDKGPQHAFNDATGFTDTLNTEEETKEFLQIVDDYVEEMPLQDARDVREKILDYCIEQDKHGEKVEFEVLSRELNDEAPKKFKEFVVEKKKENRLSQTIEDASSESPTSGSTENKAEFIPDRKSLKNYIRFSGKNKDVTLSFAATALGDDITFDPNSDQLIIKNLPSKLLKQLKLSQS